MVFLQASSSYLGQVLYARPIKELPLNDYPVDSHLPADVTFMAGSMGSPAAGDQFSGVMNFLDGYYVDSYGVPRAANAPPDRMVTWQAYLVLYVKDQAAGLAALQEVIQTQRGLVIKSANTLVTGGYSDIVVTFRVPATAFEETIAQVRALGTRVGSEQITSADVTASYIDLAARLRNLELTETELQDLLKAAQERGDTAADILTIYQSLSGIRGQIEQLRGEKSLLEESVAMAELEVTLAPAGTVPGFMPGQIFSDAWTQLRLVLRGAATGLIYGLVFLLPLLPILGIVFLVWRAYRRARSRKREK